MEESKAQKIKKVFEPMVVMLEGFEGDYNNIIEESKNLIDLDTTVRAKRLRLDIGKVRIQTGKLKDEQKAEYLRASNAIQGVHNILVWAVKDKEEKLSEIEKHFETQEKLRLEELQNSRAIDLSKYIDDAGDRVLSSMEDDVWIAYLSSKKKEHDDRMEAEKQAEIARLEKEKAEAEERERIKKENAKLKVEAEERDKQAKIEADKRAKEEAERIAKEKADQAKREEADRKLKAEYEAKLKVEAEAKAKVEAELKDKQDAELKEKEDARKVKEKELKKGDGEKIEDLVKCLNDLKSKYSFDSEEYQDKYDKFSFWVESVVVKLKGE